MASASREAVQTQIDRLFRDGTLTSMSDAQLLDRYLSARDEAAFEALVNLHGPMVLGLCRRMLRDPRDIEDAFQATFLVLVRKAPSLRDRTLLANWLYGVAYRVAVRARANLLRRKDRETSLAEIEKPVMPAADPSEPIPPALDHELNRLPAKYRIPLVLCYLKGLTHDQAADAMSCPVGTVRSRLARGRNLLKRRLTARGHAPSSALLATTLLAPAVPTSLLRATLESAARFSLTKTAGAAIAASAVESLAEGALTTMAGSRIRTIAWGLLALALTTGTVVGVVFIASRRAQSEPRAAPVAKKASESESIVLSPPRKIKPGDWLIIEVLEALPGRPISGMRMVRPDGTIPLGFYGDVQVAGLDRNQTKTKIVNHLRKFLSDDVLGLYEVDPETGGPTFETDAHGNEVVRRIKPADTDRVFVDESVNQYAPEVTADARLADIEEELKLLTLRLDDLLKGKSETAKSGSEGKTSRRPDREKSGAGDPRNPDVWKENEKTKGGYPAVEELPEAPTSPFIVGDPASEDMNQVAMFLLKEEQLLAEKQRLVAEGKASPDEVARVRSTIETLKLMLPEVVRKARERLSVAKATAMEPARIGKHKNQSRLNTARSRLEDAKKLRQQGKISEEEYVDAQSDFDLVSTLVKIDEERPEPSKEDRAKAVTVAESALRLAEHLQSKYPPTPEKPTPKEKPR